AGAGHGLRVRPGRGGREMEKMRQEWLDGLLESARVRLEDATDLWPALISPKVDPASTAKYRQEVGYFLPYLGSTEAASLTPAKALRAAGLPDLRFHDLRHTCATLLLLGGMNIKDGAERLGHGNAVMLLRTCAHV